MTDLQDLRNRLDNSLYWRLQRIRLNAEQAKRTLMYNNPVLRDNTYTGNLGPLSVPIKVKCKSCGFSH